MKNNILKGLLFALMLLSLSGTTNGEDFATVYFHDGTHKKLFLKEIEKITISKMDLDEIPHGDYMTQLVETADGTYLQDITKIDSVVFTREEIHYPKTEDEVTEMVELSSSVAVRANEIVDSMKAVGNNNPIAFAQEFMKMPNVIDVEIDQSNSCFSILRADSIYHDFILQSSLKPINRPMMQKFIAKEGQPVNKEGFKSYSRSVNKSSSIKHIERILILAPYQNLGQAKGGLEIQLDDLASSIEEEIGVVPTILTDESVDITKFYGDYLDNYDMIIIITHGGRNEKNGVRLGSSTRLSLGTIADRWFGSLPELCFMSIEGNDNSYLSMSHKFLDSASFNDALVFAFACSSFDGIYAKKSLTRSFLEHGALAYIGYNEIANTVSVENLGFNIIKSLNSGLSLQDAITYWKDCKLTHDYLELYQDYYNDNEDIYAKMFLHNVNPDLLKVQTANSNPIFVKNAYPDNLSFDKGVNNILFNWDCSLTSFKSLINCPPNDDAEVWHYNIYDNIVTYDVYVNDIKINPSCLIGNNYSWEPNITGDCKWYVVSHLSSVDYNEDIATFKSEPCYFTLDDTPSLTLSSTTLTLSANTNSSVQITSGSGSYTVVSFDPTVATAEISGNSVVITAKSSGSTYITVKDTQTNQTATIVVTVTAANNPTTDAVAVNLGLPSGTKWADRNVGASKPEDFGGYYAWGEIEEKESYIWSTYKWCNGSQSSQTKYCTDSSYGTVDNKTMLDPEDDVAYVKWGGSWKMPTLDQVKELVDNCSSEWTTVNGINGRKFTGSNGNSIFIPAAGFHGAWDLLNAGSDGYYWSSSLGESYPYFARVMYFNSGGADWDGYVREYGYSVRPVINGNITLDLALSTNTISLKVGDSSTVDIRTGSGYYTLVSDKPAVATANLSGTTITITPVAAGTATITVTDTQSGQTATIVVTVTAADNPATDAIAVDLGLPSGTKWADRNIGASKPEDYGGYYAWGETEEKEVYNWSTYIHCDGSYSTRHDIGRDIAGTEYDVAHVKWGGSWKMPTRDQIQELKGNCSSEWATVNGVKGRKFISTNGNSIFIPAAGIRHGSDLNSVGSTGYYWSSSISELDSGSASNLYFSSGYMDWNYYEAFFDGLSIRPVSE